jgi:hypothetical protein
VIDAGEAHIELGRLSKAEVVEASLDDVALLRLLQLKGKICIWERDVLKNEFLVTTPVPCITAVS